MELGNTGRITFLDWYELWLDNSLQEIKKEQKGIICADGNNVTLEKSVNAEFILKPWWKFW